MVLHKLTRDLVTLDIIFNKQCLDSKRMLQLREIGPVFRIHEG